jgi:uncharacterized protein (DUF433 family)
MSTTIKTEHPYIVQIEDVCGGRPVIKGTRTSVQTIAGYYKLGMSIEEIMEGLPHLSAAQIYDALSYYHDHQEEIERDIQEAKIQNIAKKYGLEKDKNGRLIPRNTADE